MTPEFEKDNFLSLKRLSANNHYYNEIFKRTERIASVVFYVLSYIETNERTKVHQQNLTEKAMRLHETVIATLNLHEYETKDGLIDFIQSVVALESSVHIACASRLFTADVARVITDEIDTVIRIARNHYLSADQAPAEISDRTKQIAPTSNRETISDGTGKQSYRKSTLSSTGTSTASRDVIKRQTSNTTHKPKGDVSSQASVVYGSGPARIDRIKTVLEAKGEATIKDIADIITDCSEKTIQRDLNSLIEAGEVKRYGERRWSRYVVVKS